MNKLPAEYYLQDTLFIAGDLIGKYLVNDTRLGSVALRITETEAYIGKSDRACHAYGGKITPRTKIMYEKGGSAYVYFIYGMYYCMNVVTEEEGNPCAVLIRGGEIVSGLNAAAMLRYGQSHGDLTMFRLKNMANGPGKLCKAMDIDKRLNGTSLLSGGFFIAESIPGLEKKAVKIGRGKRIGIDYAGEAKDYLWRFFQD